jgi:hypothetical protein
MRSLKLCAEPRQMLRNASSDFGQQHHQIKDQLCVHPRENSSPGAKTKQRIHLCSANLQHRQTQREIAQLIRHLHSQSRPNAQHAWRFHAQSAVVPLNLAHVSVP